MKHRHQWGSLVKSREHGPGWYRLCINGWCCMGKWETGSLFVTRKGRA